ncbi:hypothetical protein BGZ95_007986, partial [Linnemannia exigua]
IPTSAEMALMIPEIILMIGSFLPLFQTRFEEGRHMVPFGVLARNIKHVRILSLLDMKHRKHASLCEVIKKYSHIERLEIHDAVFSVRKLIGSKNHAMGHLKLSGSCARMPPFLLIFVERQVHLKTLELMRFQFTVSDWKRIITNKPHLRKLVIGQQCEFLDYKRFEEEDAIIAEENIDKKVDVKEDNSRQTQAQNTMAMEGRSSSSTNGEGTNTKRKNDDGNIDVRVKDVNMARPNAKDVGELPVAHLVLRDNRLLLPFQQVILKACPHLDQLEICYSQKADGGKVAALVKLRRLTLRSTRQTCTLAMIEDMSMSVEELILFTKQSDLQMTSATKDRADTLKRLDLDLD